MQLYETHLPVSDLERSVRFYCDVVGLAEAFRQPQRKVAFLWIGKRESGMLGLWQQAAGEGGLRKAHFAIRVELDDLHRHCSMLGNLGIRTRQFGGHESCEPSVIGWMPSAQFYFDDPDGHSVEFIALLDAAPMPGFFGTLSEWQEYVRDKIEERSRGAV